MPAKQWKVERRPHCFKILCEGRKPNITIDYGDNEHNIPSYGTVEEAQAVATIICHALNGTFLVHPRDVEDKQS